MPRPYNVGSHHHLAHDNVTVDYHDRPSLTTDIWITQCAVIFLLRYMLSYRILLCEFVYTKQPQVLFQRRLCISAVAAMHSSSAGL